MKNQYKVDSNSRGIIGTFNTVAEAYDAVEQEFQCNATNHVYELRAALRAVEYDVLVSCLDDNHMCFITAI